MAARRRSYLAGKFHAYMVLQCTSVSNMGTTTAPWLLSTAMR